jgi:hypothetical protein
VLVIQQQHFCTKIAEIENELQIEKSQQLAAEETEYNNEEIIIIIYSVI